VNSTEEEDCSGVYGKRAEFYTSTACVQRLAYRAISASAEPVVYYRNEEILDCNLEWLINLAVSFFISFLEHLR